MSLGALDLVTVTGKFRLLDDSAPRIGSKVTFTTSVTLAEASTPQTIVAAPIVVELAEDGSFSIDLPATDDPDVTPTSFTYVVFEEIIGPVGKVTRSYNLAVPLNTPGGVLDLVTAAPAQATTPSAAYVLAATHNALVDRVTVLEAGGDGGPVDGGAPDSTYAAAIDGGAP